MYDERTRQLDHHWATYAYVREEGIEYGMQQGRAEGMEQAIITLMKNGHISPEVAAVQLKLNVEELEWYL